MLNPKTPQAVYDDNIRGSCFAGVFTTTPPLDKKIEKVSERWKREVGTT